MTRERRASRALTLAICLAPLISNSAAAARVDADAVDRAVAQAVDYLKSQRNADGHWEARDASSGGGKFVGYGGTSALTLLALLYAGEDPYEPDMRASLEWLSNLDLSETYTVGTRAHVLALTPGQKFRSLLRRDVDWLEGAIYPSGAEHAGAYGYRSAQLYEGGKGRYDNSNSQYAVLGAWMASEAGATPPRHYWQLVLEHWLGDQNVDGGWGYRADTSRGSMTAAGLATLYVVYDHLGLAGNRRGVEVEAAIERGLEWLGAKFSASDHPGCSEEEWDYYYYYSVERAGRASGYKRFRQVNWFEAIAAELLKTQQADGSWPNLGGSGAWEMTSVRNTSFALMFLCHGRAPVLFNKLKWTPPDLRDEPYEPLTPEIEKELSRKELREREEAIERRFDWRVKPRDVAGLTRYAERSLERLLNWQIVQLDASLEELLEAPVLYLSGAHLWEFTAEERAKLAEYCARGGLLTAAAHRNSPRFIAGMRDLAQQLFPDYELQRIDANHPLLSGEVRSKIDEPPPIFEVSNGRRTLMLLVGGDAGEAWQHYAQRPSGPELELGANIYLYATDKARVRSRLHRVWLAPRQTPVKFELPVARIKHAGAWNPEPFGWERLATYLRNETGAQLKPQTLTLDDPALAEHKAAHLTGYAPLRLSESERQGLRRFLTGGGTLLVDALDGSQEFYESVDKLLFDALHVPSERLPDQSPLLTGAGLEGGVSLRGASYRRAARRESLGREYPRLMAHRLGRQVVALVSPLDLTTGLLGARVYGCRGYESDSALRMMRNMLMYARLSPLEKARLGKD